MNSANAIANGTVDAAPITGAFFGFPLSGAAVFSFLGSFFVCSI